jgi:transcriptional regulator with XRE-family HTH domain
MNTPNNLKAYRIDRGLKQREVAKQLGFTGICRISRWESGLAEPSAMNLLKLADIYGVHPRKLYEDATGQLPA